MPPKKKTKVKPSPALASEHDPEEGGYTWWPKYKSEQRDEHFHAKGEVVQVGDFGDEWQPGTVVIAGHQMPPNSVTYENPQFHHKKKPKIRPNDWPHGVDGYVWDIIEKKDTNQRAAAKFNDAKHLRLAVFVIICIVAWGFLDFAVNLQRMIEIMTNSQETITAFDLAKLGNDTISIILCLLVYLLWATLCFKFVHIRHIWSWQPWIFNGQSMMPGGFIPRPSAISLGLLMFLSSVFITERVAGGASLFARNDNGSYRSTLGHGELCRADVREESQYQDVWFSRLGRLSPSGCFLGTCGEDDMDPGCKATRVHGSPKPLHPLLFNTSLDNSSMPHSNFVHPYGRTSHMTITMIQGLKGLLPMFFNITLDDNMTIDEGHTCMYQCVKWRSYGFNDIVSKVGTIGAGNAIVTKMTEAATSYLGYKTVTADTTAKELRELLRHTKPDHDNFFHKHFSRSAAVPAIIFAFLRVFLAVFVYKIDDHGFFTVDYYVSQVLLFAVITSIICRKYNLFRWEKVLYCNNLWSQGSEKFVIPDSVDGDSTMCKPKTVDLLVWLHMNFEERAYLLIDFARKISEKYAPKDSHLPKVMCFMEQIQEVSVLGEGLTKESRIVRIKRHQTTDAWPQGKIHKMTGGMAWVQWDEEHVCAVLEDEEGTEKGWLDRLRSESKGCACSDAACRKCKRYREATTTQVDPLQLFEISAAWDKLLNDYVGIDEQAVDAVRGRILWRIQRDSEDGSQAKADASTLDGSKEHQEDERRRPVWFGLSEDKRALKVKADEEAKWKQERHFMKHHSATPALNSNASTPLLGVNAG